VSEIDMEEWIRGFYKSERPPGIAGGSFGGRSMLLPNIKGKILAYIKIYNKISVMS
jgi:hypothetical protein